MYVLTSRSGDPTPRLEEVDPPPLTATEVRVAVSAAGFTEYDAVAAANHDLLGLPDVVGLGFDFSGVVTEAGADVHDLRVGQRVAGVHGDVTARARAQATEVVAPEASLAAVPDDLDDHEAATVPLVALAARQGLDLLGEGRGRLLVTGGAGGVGGWSIALAAREGWLVDALVRPGTEGLVNGSGASAVITSLPTASYDAVLDAGALQEVALEAVKDSGRFVGVKPGQPVDPVRGIDVSTVLSRPDGPTLACLLTLATTRAAPVRIATTRPLEQAAGLYAEAMDAPGSGGRWLLVP